MSNGKTLLVFCSLAVVVAVAIHSASGATSSHPQGRAVLGGNCDNKTTNCSTTYSVCSSTGKCVCEAGYEQNGTTCVIMLNSKCNSTRPCNRTGAECNGGVCKCKQTHVVSINNRNCLPIAAKLYDLCTEEQQCSRLVNSKCLEGACRCRDNYFQTSNTACQMNSCQSGSCDNMGYATCVGGYCQCLPGGFPYGPKCYQRVVGLGGSCTALDLCYLIADGPNQNVGCQKGKCTCNKKYKPNKDNTSCSGAESSLISITVLLLAVVAAVQT